MSRSSSIPRWLKKLLLTVSTLGAAAVTFVLMRREGDRLTGLKDAGVDALKGRLSGKSVSSDSDKPSAPATAPATPRPVPRVPDHGSRGDHAKVATFPKKADSAEQDPEPRRCVATTTSGKRCSREVGLDEEYCWQHGPE